ncbi:MAG: hypothetical protein Q9217_004490, partial [Psora testacea]
KIKELLEKVPENYELYQVFCRSILWLEEHLFVQDHILQKPLESEEIERCDVIWYIYEYVSATWPKYKPVLPSLLEDMLYNIKSSPAPRVDTSLYVAIAETLAGKHYGQSEMQIPKVLQNPKLKSGEGFSAALLKIETYQLQDAVLHRAVCHEDKEKNVALTEQLLGNITDTNVDFVNNAGQSTLHVATIFFPTVSTVELLLDTNRVEFNKADKHGETALLAASMLGKEDILLRLLNKASINVNLSGGLSPEVMAVIYNYASFFGESDPFCQYHAPENVVCHREHSRGFIIQEKTVVEWYAWDLDWTKLEIIASNPSFKMMKSFRNWNFFFQHMNEYRSIFLDNRPNNYGFILREIFLEHVKKDPNQLDKEHRRALGGRF